MPDTSSHYNLEAFTHPLSLEPISIYYNPDSYYKKLESDSEGGWNVIIKQKLGNFFRVDIDELKLYDIWIQTGDIGLIVQNYDSIPIPVYNNPHINSKILTTLYKSYIGLVCDISDNFVQLKIDSNNDIIGWVEKKYLCSSPYTTCN
jgi:hypothetical protein